MKKYMCLETLACRAFQCGDKISGEEMFGGTKRHPIFATRLRKTDSSSKVCKRKSVVFLAIG